MKVPGPIVSCLWIALSFSVSGGVRAQVAGTSPLDIPDFVAFVHSIAGSERDSLPTPTLMHPNLWNTPAYARTEVECVSISESLDDYLQGRLDWQIKRPAIRTHVQRNAFLAQSVPESSASIDETILSDEQAAFVRRALMNAVNRLDAKNSKLTVAILVIGAPIIPAGVVGEAVIPTFVWLGTDAILPQLQSRWIESARTALLRVEGRVRENSRVFRVITPMVDHKGRRYMRVAFVIAMQEGKEVLFASVRRCYYAASPVGSYVRTLP